MTQEFRTPFVKRMRVKLFPAKGLNPKTATINGETYDVTRRQDVPASVVFTLKPRDYNLPGCVSLWLRDGAARYCSAWTRGEEVFPVFDKDVHIGFL